jgi:Uncharacterised nucleotidyltransferase
MTIIQRPDSQSDLERFLCGDLDTVPTLEMLRAGNLEAFAYTKLHASHPLKTQVRAAFLVARARHELIRREVIELVKVWNAAGIQPVLYKGFALSEFVYDHPGVRFHGDVDVLIHPDDFWRALEIARQHAWKTGAVAATWPKKHPHELSIKHPLGSTVFDVHRWLVQTTLPWVGLEHRLTLEAWKRTTMVDWEGVQIRLLAAEDAFIFGLVIARCWTGDRWRLKTHDFLDGVALIKRHGLTRKDVLQRADKLRVRTTVESYLRMCDPFQNILQLRQVSNMQALRKDLATHRDHVPLAVAFLISSISFIGPMLSQIPLLVRCAWTVVAVKKLDLILCELEKLPLRSAKIPPGHLVHALWNAAKVFRLTSSLIWPLAVYAALWRHGYRPQFRYGEHLGKQHAWVELEGEVLPGFAVTYGPVERFRVIFEHPNHTDQS